MVFYASMISVTSCEKSHTPEAKSVILFGLRVNTYANGMAHVAKTFQTRQQHSGKMRETLMGSGGF
jgi:hypothetical protein